MAGAAVKIVEAFGAAEAVVVKPMLRVRARTASHIKAWKKAKSA